MLTREEVEFRRKVTGELSGIRRALEKIADALAKSDGTDNSREIKNDHREE